MSAIAAVILAAGEGRRMGGPNKLLAEIGGVSLIRRVAEAARASRARPIIVVTGHQSAAIAAGLAGIEVSIVHNVDFVSGLSTSLKAGIAAVGAEVDGALILLGDMPFVDAETIDALIQAFGASGGQSIVTPVHEGRRGNPVLWPRRFFPALMAIEGDKGARDILLAHAGEIVEIAAGPAIMFDVDTPEALREAGGRSAD